MNHLPSICARVATRAKGRVARCTAVVGFAAGLSLASAPVAALPVTTFTLSADGTQITYHVANTASQDNGYACTPEHLMPMDATCAINGISLPEYTMGDLDFTGGLPAGWTIDLPSSDPEFSGASVVGGTAADYVNLTHQFGNVGTPIYVGTSLDFTALIPKVGLIDANVGYLIGFELPGTGPAPIPDTRASVVGVPEPSTFAMLGIGLAGLLAARRRRKS